MWGLNEDRAWSTAGSGWKTATTAPPPPAPTITTVGNNPPSFTINLGSYATSACTFVIEKDTVSLDGFEYYDSVACAEDESGGVGATYTDEWVSNLTGRRYYYRAYAVTSDDTAGTVSNVLEIIT